MCFSLQLHNESVCETSQVLPTKTHEGRKGAACQSRQADISRRLCSCGPDLCSGRHGNEKRQRGSGKHRDKCTIRTYFAFNGGSETVPKTSPVQPSIHNPTKQSIHPPALKRQTRNTKRCLNTKYNPPDD